MVAYKKQQAFLGMCLWDVTSPLQMLVFHGNTLTAGFPYYPTFGPSYCATPSDRATRRARVTTPHLAVWPVELADGNHALHTPHTAIQPHIPAQRTAWHGTVEGVRAAHCV